MAPQITYIAKHGFRGNVAQAQISFPQGAAITAKPGQEGNAWWWGSYQGKEGWFPPAYVTPTQAAPPPQQQQQFGQAPPPMQQQMQQASFAPAAQQQQQQRVSMYPPAAQQQQFAPQQPRPVQPTTGFGQPPRGAFHGSIAAPGAGRGQPAQGFNNSFSPTTASAPVGGLHSSAGDPFAGLDLAPAPMSLGAPATTNPPPLPATTTQPTPQMASSRSSTPSTPKLSSVPSTDGGDSAAAALARMGVSPTASRTTSPAPVKIPRVASPMTRASPTPTKARTSS